MLSSSCFGHDTPEYSPFIRTSPSQRGRARFGHISKDICRRWLKALRVGAVLQA
jgi:hypothetical protein